MGLEEERSGTAAAVLFAAAKGRDQLQLKETLLTFPDAPGSPFDTLPLPRTQRIPLANIEEHLAGYHKVLSMCHLAEIGLPVLPGLIIGRWSDRVALDVREFACKGGWKELLLRHDRRFEVPSAPRGGFILPLRGAAKVAKSFLQESRIVVFLEPRSPYDDLYSVNALVSEDGSEAELEVVGPGFDASDLNRGDAMPHERILIRLTRAALSARDAIVHRSVVAPDGYKRSVADRFRKIARRSRTGQSVEGGRGYLRSRGHDLLLRHADEYREIPERFLQAIVSNLSRIPRRIQRLSGQTTKFIVSMGVLHPDERLVFWDVVWPRLKYAVGPGGRA